MHQGHALMPKRLIDQRVNPRQLRTKLASAPV
jgi:hypothetical protein